MNHRDIKHPQAGGAEQVLLEIGKRLARHFNVTWLSEEVPGLPREELMNQILIKRRGNRETLHLYSLMEARKHDIVLDSVAHAVPFFSHKVNRRTVALVHHVHQDVLDQETKLSWVLKWMERRVVGYERVIAVSETTKRELIKLGFKGKVTVIYNGVDHSKFLPGKKNEDPLVLWIGRLKRYKNPLDVVEISKGSAFRFLIAGGGELEEEVKRASGGNLTYLGRVSEGEKISLYQRAWVLLSTSSVEGFGMTVIEANACATPAVVYDRGSLSEIVRNGVNGYVVGYKDIQGMREAIEKTVENIDAMTKGSYEESLKYDWDKTAERYRTYLEEMSGK